MDHWISPPFLDRISLELFVQATKQSQIRVYYNRFCVYSPTKMHQNPKRKFKWRSLGLSRNRSARTQSSQLSTKKIHWPQLLKSTQVFTCQWFAGQEWGFTSHGVEARGFPLMDLGKFHRHFRSPVGPRLLDVQGEFTVVAYWWLAETQFQVDNFEKSSHILFVNPIHHWIVLINKSRARNIWPPLHYK